MLYWVKQVCKNTVIIFLKFTNLIEKHRKYVKFLKGPTAKFKPQLDGHYCGEPGRRMFFVVIKKFQASLKDKENNRFKIL